MGQSNSTPKNSSPPPTPPPPPAGTAVSSLDGLRNASQWVLSSTNKALGVLGGAIVSVAKPVVASIPVPGRKGSSLPPAPPPSLSSQMVTWIRKNAGKTLLGTLLLGVAVVAGSIAYKSGKAYHRELKKLRVVRGADGSKREVIVITNGASIEGMVLALDLDNRGFIVFVCVPDSSRADEILSWKRADIHPVIVPDLSNETLTGSIESLDVEAWRSCMDANVTGTIQAIQQFLPLLKRTLSLRRPRRSPRLILVTSTITGNIGLPYQSATCASQHAILSIADSLRREVQHWGIDVVCLKKGIFTTGGSRSDKSNKTVDNKPEQPGLACWRVSPLEMLKSMFKQPSTSEALCEATFDVVIATRPETSRAVGFGSLAYSFVGWIAPNRVLDWSIRRTSMARHSSLAINTTAAETF
ncbi:hypothetical protein BGZ65_011237 [Modicella reniformis]|uniref:Uncharacterized protein n=1 Tax=Modicella reniformis TaxID=1440133 RepID=A0A9P6IPC9_9FUNG|nr:hypothetical protein BGZ65_011237 [Modicella reniformis]